MRYVVSDIHGCYEEFRELLELIHFTEEDEMYLLGDLVDRGPKPILLLKDLMGRDNIYPILGNHDYMALKILKKMNVVITEEILDYLSEASVYEEIQIGNKRYVLVHGGLEDFREDKALSEYALAELLFRSPDYSKRLFADENTYLITGHTPTSGIPGHEKAEIYRSNGHIAVDCGCVFGGRLAAFCLDTEEEFYVDCRLESRRYG